MISIKEIKECAVNTKVPNCEGKIAKIMTPKKWEDSFGVKYIFYNILVADTSGIIHVAIMETEAKPAPVTENDFGKNILITDATIRARKIGEKEVYLYVNGDKGGKVKISAPPKIEKSKAAIMEKEKPLPFPPKNKKDISSKKNEMLEKKPPVEEKIEHSAGVDEQLLKDKVEFWFGVWKDKYSVHGIPFEVFKDIAVSSFIQGSNNNRDLERANYIHSLRLKEIAFQEELRAKLKTSSYSYPLKIAPKNTVKISDDSCSKCKKKISAKVKKFSVERFGAVLCMDCQKQIEVDPPFETLPKARKM